MLIASGVMWHLALWPGAVTHDTLFLLGEAERGVYSDAHPLLNGVLLSVLAVPFRTIAIYSTVQVLFCTGITVFCIYRLHRLGCPDWLLFLVCGVFALSIPIGLYKSMIWKDVPTSYMVMLLGVLIYELSLNQKTWYVSGASVVMLALGLGLLSFLRHGWELNLLIVPVFVSILGQGKLQAKSIMRIWFAAGLSLLFFGVILQAVTKHPTDSKLFSRMEQLLTVQPLLAVLNSPSGYISDDYARDDRLVERMFVSREALANYNYSHTEPVLKYLSPSFGSIEGVYYPVLELCALNFAACLTDRIGMFLSTIMPGAKLFGMTFYDLGAVSECRSVVSDAYCRTLERYVLIHPRKDFWRESAGRLVKWSNSQSDPFPKLWIWNIMPSFALLVAALLVGRWLPSTAAAAFFVLLQTMVPFATSIANDFRFYFFVYMGGFFVIPMMVTEWKVRMFPAPSSGGGRGVSQGDVSASHSGGSHT